MEKTLTFSGGKKLQNSYALEGRSELFVYVEDEGATLPDVFKILADEKKTKKIVYKYSEAEYVFEGYTKLVSIRDEGTAITAMLTREEKE